MIPRLEELCKKIIFENYNVQELNLPNYYKNELLSIKDIFYFDEDLFQEIINDNNDKVNESIIRRFERLVRLFNNE